MKKEFWELNGLNTSKEDFEANGFKVINFGMVKTELMKILVDEETANKYHLWNSIIEPDNKEMKAINEKLSQIVFKESRGGGGYTVIGWENGESYLRYHSGIFYRWFKPQYA